MPNIDLSILNQRQTPAFFADTLANRPSAGFLGRIFVSTDTFAFYRDNGTGWDLIGGPGTGTITGTGTTNTFTIFTGANSIGDSSYLTQSANRINVANSDIYLPQNNVSGGTNYGIRQVMADTDYWKIYGNTQSSTDSGELVFEIGDNSGSSALDRFRFTINDGVLPTDKDLLTLDFDESIYNTNLIVSNGYNLGVGINVPSGLIHADGGTSAARIIIDADNGIARIFSFRTDNLPRWALRVDGSESGSNVGGDFSIRRYDDLGAFIDAPLGINRATGQSTFAKKVVIENNTGDQQLQIVSSTAPSLRIDNLQTGATRRIGIGLATTTNNFIQGTTGGEMAIFNSSTTPSPILFGVYDAGAGNTQEAARISAARNLLVGGVVDAGFKLDVSGTSRFNGLLTISANSSANAIAINGRSSDNTGSIDFFQNNGTSRLMEIGVSPSAAEFYYDANAPMKFYTNGTEKLTIASSGEATFAGSVTSAFWVEASSGGAIARAQVNSGAGRIVLTDSRVGGIRYDLGCVRLGAGTFSITDSTTGGAPSRLAIFNTGNVNIGDAIPIDNGNRLQVSGGASMTGSLTMNGTYTRAKTLNGTANSSNVILSIDYGFPGAISGNVKVYAMAGIIAGGNLSTCILSFNFVGANNAGGGSANSFVSNSVLSTTASADTFFTTIVSLTASITSATTTGFNISLTNVITGAQTTDPTYYIEVSYGLHGNASIS